MKIVILINKLSENPLPDELDVLHQAEVVEKSLIELGHTVQIISMDMNLAQAELNIKNAKPDYVFNLFEGVVNRTDMLYVSSGLLQSMKIPYSGCRVDSIFITADKSLTKKILKLNNIPTADWFLAKEYKLLDKNKRYIVKPTSEDASLGITEKSVITGLDMNIINEYFEKYGNNFFIEEYIDGREFNISIVATDKGAKMLSPAEIIFTNYPENKPKILGYEAKWDDDSFECINTNRTFEFAEQDKPLLDKLERIVLNCWTVLNLHGYARVDFRVDKNNNPFVLEINANPCISEDSGFYAAAVKSCFTFTQIIDNIIKDSY